MTPRKRGSNSFGTGSFGYFLRGPRASKGAIGGRGVQHRGIRRIFRECDGGNIGQAGGERVRTLVGKLDSNTLRPTYKPYATGYVLCHAG